MNVIHARNVNYALESGIHFLRTHGVRRDSRNGPVLVAPTPVTTVYERPQERVLFCPERDANPFFHLVEALWMLAGRNDLATLTPYVARFKDFSDDGRLLYGAYGYRWRKQFTSGEIIAGTGGQTDQLAWAIKRLKGNPDDRRVIIQMYDANRDQWQADQGGRDIPCNIVTAPWIDTDGALSMSIFCRSNDIIWGAYGANAVHFSVMQEYLAAGVGVPLGKMYQVSNNYHAYLDTIDKMPTGGWLAEGDEYLKGDVCSYSLFSGMADEVEVKQFDEDLTFFFDEPTAPGLRSIFLRRVAGPIVQAHKAYRKKDDPQRFETALEIVAQCTAIDWRLACQQWLHRRRTATLDKEIVS